MKLLISFFLCLACAGAALGQAVKDLPVLTTLPDTNYVIVAVGNTLRRVPKTEFATMFAGPALSYKADFGRGPNATAQSIIIDTDIGGGDVDDFLDLWFAHRLMDRGEVNILGVMNSVTNGYGAPVIELVNRYFGRGHIPVGQNKDSVPGGTTGYTLALSTNWPNSLRDGTNATDAITLYQTILSNQPNQSVKIIVTGPLHQLSNLWGRASQLVSNKVSEVIIVAGSFPQSSSDFNLGAAPNAAKVVYSMRSVPVTWVGITNVGDEVSTARFWDSLAPQFSPIYDAMGLYGATSRPGWAQMGIWYAARGTNYQGTNFFDVVSKGTNVIVTGAGSNYWQTLAAPLNEKYLVRVAATNRFSDMIDSLLFERFPASYGKLPSGAAGTLLGAKNTGNWEGDVVITRSGKGSGALVLAGSAFATHFFFEPDQAVFLRGGYTNSPVWINDAPGLGPIVLGQQTFATNGVVAGSVGYIDGMLVPASNLTNYTVTATNSERTLNMTNAVRFTALAGSTAGKKDFACVTLTNYSGSTQTLNVTNAWKAYGPTTNQIPSGKVARLCFEVEGANVRYSMTWED